MTNEPADISRADLLLKGALVVGGLYGLSAVGPYVQRAFATEEDTRSDVDILNFLLFMEYIEVSLYNRVNTELNSKDEKMPLKPEEKELTGLLFKQEAEHVASLKEMIEQLGGKPDKKGEFAFAFATFSSFLTIAGVIERAGVGAFNGAIPSLESKEARDLTFSIAQVEGRHAAAVLIPKRQEPAPEAFDLGYTEETAMNSVVQFTGVFPTP